MSLLPNNINIRFGFLSSILSITAFAFDIVNPIIPFTFDSSKTLKKDIASVIESPKNKESLKYSLLDKWFFCDLSLLVLILFSCFTNSLSCHTLLVLFLFTFSFVIFNVFVLLTSEIAKEIFFLLYFLL